MLIFFIVARLASLSGFGVFAMSELLFAGRLFTSIVMLYTPKALLSIIHSPFMPRAEGVALLSRTEGGLGSSVPLMLYR